MPWTRKQVRFLESSGSPLTPEQKTKMNAELHEDPAMGHERKGSPALKKSAKPKKPRIESETHQYNWRTRHGRNKARG